MKCNLDPATTPEQKMDRFNGALRQVLTVSKAELNQRIEAEKLANQSKPKRGPRPKAK